MSKIPYFRFTLSNGELNAELVERIADDLRLGIPGEKYPSYLEKLIELTNKYRQWDNFTPLENTMYKNEINNLKTNIISRSTALTETSGNFNSISEFANYLMSFINPLREPNNIFQEFLTEFNAFRISYLEIIDTEAAEESEWEKLFAYNELTFEEAKQMEKEQEEEEAIKKLNKPQ